MHIFLFFPCYLPVMWTHAKCHPMDIQVQVQTFLLFMQNAQFHYIRRCAVAAVYMHVAPLMFYGDATAQPGGCMWFSTIWDKDGHLADYMGLCSCRIITYLMQVLTPLLCSVLPLKGTALPLVFVKEKYTRHTLLIYSGGLRILCIWNYILSIHSLNAPV